MIADSDKTKADLLNELTASRQRVQDLEGLVREHEQTEARLKNEIQRTQHYLDIAGVIFLVVDKEQRVILINQKGCEILGYQAEEIIGKNWFETFLPVAVRNQVKGIFEQLLAGEIEDAEFFENPVLTKSGQERMIAWHNKIIKDEQGQMIASLSSGRDVTDHKQAQAALKQYQNQLEALVEERTANLKASNDRLQAEISEREQVEQALRESQMRLANILDIAKEAIISIDGAGRIVLFNRGAEEIFAYSAAEAIGQPLDILLPKRFVAYHSQHIADFARSHMTARLMGERQTIFGLRKHGEEFPAEASISKVEINGDKIFTVVLRDITARKQVEAEREKLIAELKALSQAAQAITSELSLEQVLQTIVEASRVLVNVKYAALGVHDEQGHLSRFVTSGIEAADYVKIGAWPAGRGLLQLIFHQGQSLIVDDIARHPVAVGFPEYHPDMQNLLGVPIFSKGKLIGALYMADKEDGTRLAENDQKLVEMLTLHAAIAIENAHLYEQRQQLALLEERERFARDLHDGIIQSLYAVGLGLDQIKLDIAPINQAAADHIDLSLKSLAGVIQDIRTYIFDLRPQAIQQRGLKARLSGLIDELRVNIRLPVKAEIYPDIDSCLTDQQASHLFHISHEALSNAARHAKANQIVVRLTREDETVTLQIEDDGLGFEAPPQINPGHRGLANIQSRVSVLGATMTLDTRPQQGTRLTITLRSRLMGNGG